MSVITFLVGICTMLYQKFYDFEHLGTMVLDSITECIAIWVYSMFYYGFHYFERKVPQCLWGGWGPVFWTAHRSVSEPGFIPCSSIRNFTISNA